MAVKKLSKSNFFITKQIATVQYRSKKQTATSKKALKYVTTNRTVIVFVRKKKQRNKKNKQQSKNNFKNKNFLLHNNLSVPMQQKKIEISFK